MLPKQLECFHCSVKKGEKLRVCERGLAAHSSPAPSPRFGKKSSGVPVNGDLWRNSAQIDSLETEAALVEFRRSVYHTT